MNNIRSKIENSFVLKMEVKNKIIENWDSLWEKKQDMILEMIELSSWTERYLQTRLSDKTDLSIDKILPWLITKHKIKAIKKMELDD